MKNGCGEKFLLLIKAVLFASLISFLTVVTVTFAVFPASPSPIFVLCVLLSFLSGEEKFVIISGICGLFVDILSQNVILTNTCLFAYITLGCVWLNKRVNCSLKTAILCVFASVFLQASLNSLLSFGFSPFFYMLIEKVAFETLLSLAIAVVIYPLAKAVTAKQRCFSGKEKM